MRNNRVQNHSHFFCDMSKLGDENHSLIGQMERLEVTEQSLHLCGLSYQVDGFPERQVLTGSVCPSWEGCVTETLER